MNATQTNPYVEPYLLKAQALIGQAVYRISCSSCCYYTRGPYSSQCFKCKPDQADYAHTTGTLG